MLQLVGEWLEDGQMVSCPFPDHEDSTPSFNLWSPDDEGVPQRFGCFGCGRKGNVLDFIAEWERLDTRGAIARAAQLAEEEARDGTPRERTVRERIPVDLEGELARLNERIVVSLPGFERYMAARGMSGDELERFAMDSWGWLPAGGLAVAAPHRSGDGTLVGIKFRTADKKWSADGSVYDDLYGAWRDRGRAKVLLCEGESDAVWASWALRDEPDWDVLGLPSGVQQPIRPDWLRRLEGRDVFLALDGDAEGVRASRQWFKERPDALLVRLPEGEDLQGCGIPVRELLERAEAPRKASGLVTVDADANVFAKTTQQGVAPIADFAYRPVRELYTPEGPAWEVVMSDDRQPTLIRASDFLSSASITRWANKHGVSWFGGSGAAIQGLFNWTKARSAFLPLERATTRAGKIGRSYVGPGFRIGPDRVRYVPPGLGDARLESRLQIEEGPWSTRTLPALEQLNDPGTMAIILGWLTATLLRGQQAPAPPLFVAGESGAGKTNLLSAVLGTLGFGIDANLTTTTPYGVDCFVNSCVGFPVWFDEYRVGAREDSMQRLRQLLRDAYYGQPSVKGGMTSQATELSEVWTWAGIIVSGEMSSHETSHRDRMIMLDLDPDKKNREAMKFLRGANKSGLGHALLTFLAARRTPFVINTKQFSQELPERFREALGFVEAGWQAWKEFRWEAGLRDAATEPDYLLLIEDRSGTVDPWLEALRVCEGMYTRDNNPIVRREDDGSVVLIPAEIIVEARRVGIELPARANEMVSWLKRRYVVEDVRIGSRRGKRVKGLEL